MPLPSWPLPLNPHDQTLPSVASASVQSPMAGATTFFAAKRGTTHTGVSR